jgi:hypothetical protein
MRKSWRRRPHLEALDSMSLLSTGLAGGPFHAVAAALHGAPRVSTISAARVALNGTFHGRYQFDDGIPDVCPTYSFTGHESLRRLGPADVTGNAHSPGFIVRGRAAGARTPHLTHAAPR